MNERDAQRFLDEQRYQAELPFPVSAVFTHYARSSTKNYAIRSLQLVATAQSTIRYAAIVTACDYATNPDADETVLNWLRQEWLGGKKPSFGTWYGALMRLLAESGKTWKNPFVPEFAEIDRDLLEKKIQPLIHGRNVEIGHAEYYEALAMKHFIEMQEENLFAVMEQFSFLSRYPLAFAEVEDEYEPPSPGTKQAVNICRGASHNFARYTVAPSHPLPPGIPFIWNGEYTGALTLSPFLIYGRATTDAEQREKVKGVAHIQGLMVLNGVPKGSPVYTSVDAEAQFSLDSFEFPPKEKIQEQVESALKKGMGCPERIETRLAEEEKELFFRTTDYVETTHEKESAPPSKNKPLLKTILVSAILCLLVFIAGFALYSRFMAPKQQIRSIAVLPLKNLSNDPGQESFTEGMHEILITNLWKISGLRVPGATTVSKYRNTEKSIPEIARELHVDAIIEGSVYRIGNTVRINVQLIRGESDSHIWAEEYTMELQDVLIQQSRLAETIARKIQAAVTSEDKQRLSISYRVNPEAFDAYVKGLNSLKIDEKFTITTYGNDALDYFQQAVTIDPNFALAYTGIANVYNWWGQMERMPPREAYPRAKNAAEKALTLNKNLAEAYTQLAWTNLYFDWDMEAAAKHLNRALELNPGYSLVHFYYREYYMTMGRWDEAIEEIRRAQTIEPTNDRYTILLSITLNRAGKCEEARKEAEKLLKMAPEDYYALYLLAESYEFAGNYDEALNIVPRMEKSGYTSKESQSLRARDLQLFRARNLMKLGRRDEARRIFSELIGEYKHLLKTNPNPAIIL